MEPITIAVMGATGSGKTTFINAVSGSSLGTSAGLRSCTEHVEESSPFELDGREVVLIDTPGFDDTTRSETEILQLIAEYLAKSYQNGRKLSGLLFMHPISDFRMGGISTRSFRIFQQLCGESTLKNVLIVTNMWGQVDRGTGEARERELASEDIFFKPALDKGAKIVKHLDTPDSAKEIVRSILKNQEIIMEVQKEIVIEEKGIDQTAAAAEIDKELKEMAERQRLENERMRAEAEATLKRQQEEARKRREEESRRILEELAKVEAERRKAEENIRRQQEEYERRMREEQEAIRQQEERTRQEHEAHMEALRKQAADEEWRRQQEEQRLRHELEHERQRQRQGGGGGGGCSIQ